MLYLGKFLTCVCSPPLSNACDRGEDYLRSNIQI